MEEENPILRDLKRKHDLDLLLEHSEIEALPEGLEKDFRRLAIRWKSETALSSKTQETFEHPYYQAIIEMGPAVVSFILRELQRRPGHWFNALWVITGADPVPKEEAGDLEMMAKRWIEWGKARGFIK